MKAALGVRFCAGAAVAAVAFFAVAMFAFLVGMGVVPAWWGVGLRQHWLSLMLMGKIRLSKRANQFFSPELLQQSTS
jgi:hypothetical protein